MKVSPSWRSRILVIIALALMAVYPIYRNAEYGLAFTQYGRQVAFFEGNIEFYNPWQYRILCPLICEGMYWAYTYTVDQLIPLVWFFPDDNPEVLRYYAVFVLFRIAIHLAIFYLCIRWYRHFVQNPLLIYLGLALLTLIMGNAVRDSDFSFNTYVDVILFLWTAIVVTEQRSPWWIVLISFLGALNRETALLIPFLLFWVSRGESVFQKSAQKIIGIALIGLSVFLITAISIRWYYGYVPPDWQVSIGEVLRQNLTGIRGFKTLFEIFGAVCVLPFFIWRHGRQCHLELRRWYWGLVPIWFIVHLGYTAAWESRLFLVPVVVVFLPMTLELVDLAGRNRKKV